jgi:DNA processing protein
MIMAALKYWVWLASLQSVRTVTLKRLVDWFGSPELVFFADDKTYEEIPGLLKQEIAALSEKNLHDAKKTLDDCETYGFRIMTLHDGDYPARLKNIPDPPLVLYIRGRLPALDEEAAVAVVGTRSCTPYGLKAAERIGYELARHGCLVVSGLARGIDSAAAKGTLRAGGRVVGVVGSGLDIVYPPENKKLFDDVAAVGAIVSEYPPGSPAAPGHFPQRNRVMSGLSGGVTVIEAPEKSGALITATHALEQGRDVFAIPGNVDSPACKVRIICCARAPFWLRRGVRSRRNTPLYFRIKLFPYGKKSRLTRRLKSASLNPPAPQTGKNRQKKRLTIKKPWNILT